MTPLNFRVRVHIALIEFSISVLEFADLGVRQTLQYICSIVANDASAFLVLDESEHLLIFGQLVHTASEVVDEGLFGGCAGLGPHTN